MNGGLGKRAEPLERRRRRLQVLVVEDRGRRQPDSSLRVVFPHEDQAVRLVVGERAKQHGVHDARARERAADPDREADDADRGENGTSSKVSDGVNEIQPHMKTCLFAEAPVIVTGASAAN